MFLLISFVTFCECHPHEPPLLISLPYDYRTKTYTLYSKSRHVKDTRDTLRFPIFRMFFLIKGTTERF